MRPISTAFILLSFLALAVYAIPIESSGSKSKEHVEIMEKSVSPVSKAAEVGINFNFDLLGIAEAVSNAIKTAANREAFVRNLMYTAFYASNQKYNVMVFNLAVGQEHSLTGVKAYASAVYDGIIYGVWVFESGTFENKGDGGWINWAFKGWFDRNGMHVSFRKP